MSTIGSLVPQAVIFAGVVCITARIPAPSTYPAEAPRRSGGTTPATQHCAVCREWTLRVCYRLTQRATSRLVGANIHSIRLHHNALPVRAAVCSAAIDTSRHGATSSTGTSQDRRGGARVRVGRLGAPKGRDWATGVHPLAGIRAATLAPIPDCRRRGGCRAPSAPCRLHGCLAGCSPSGPQSPCTLLPCTSGDRRRIRTRRGNLCDFPRGTARTRGGLSPQRRLPVTRFCPRNRL